MCLQFPLWEDMDWLHSKKYSYPTLKQSLCRALNATDNKYTLAYLTLLSLSRSLKSLSWHEEPEHETDMCYLISGNLDKPKGYSAQLHNFKLQTCVCVCVCVFFFLSYILFLFAIVFQLLMLEFLVWLTVSLFLVFCVQCIELNCLHTGKCAYKFVFMCVHLVKLHIF